jgi:hypothetical protein
MASCRGTKWLLALLVLLLAGIPRAGLSDLYVNFLVDRSGSMWAPLEGLPKILHVSQAMVQVLGDLDPETIVGLRVYPPPYSSTGAEEPGIRIPLEPGNRDPFLYELKHLNPQGKAPLAENLEKALKDFPPGDHRRLLLLLCDSSDAGEESFCEKTTPWDAPDELGFHILALGVDDPADQAELNCLADQLSGVVTHVTEQSPLSVSLLSITRKALQEEAARQQRIDSEVQRLSDLSEKTRIQVDFRNTLDPFFADSIEIVQCRVGDQDIALDPPVRLAHGEKAVLWDRPAPQGEHRIVIQYRKWKAEEAATSRVESSAFSVREGETTHIRCLPKSGLFHWGCHFQETAP